MTVISFPRVDSIEDRIDDFKKLSVKLFESDSLEEFINKTTDQKYNLDFFNQLYKYYSETFINATINGNNNLKTIFAEEQAQGIFKNFAKEFVNSLAENPQLNHSITLNAIANNIADGLEQNSGQNTINREKLYNSGKKDLGTCINECFLDYWS